MRLNLNQASDPVTFSANVAGSLTTVYKIKVPEKVVYSLYDQCLLVMQLKDSSAAQIPAVSEIVIAGIRPGRRLPVEIDGFDYRPWYSLSTISDQYDSTKNGKLHIRIDGGKLDLLENHELLIQVKSTAVVDESNSLFELEIEQNPHRDND
jgi:hypothetical protein